MEGKKIAERGCSDRSGICRTTRARAEDRGQVTGFDASGAV